METDERRIAITGAQRDALYQELLNDLSGFGDLRDLYEGEVPDLEACWRTGRRMADALRLIQDGGLGWGDVTSEAGDLVVLTLPADELRGILGRQLHSIILHQELNRDDLERDEEQRVRLAREACESARDQMRGGQS